MTTPFFEGITQPGDADAAHVQQKPRLSELDAAAQKALIVALFNFFILLLPALWSTLLLMRVWKQPGRLSRRGQRFAFLALTIDLFALAIAALFVYAMSGGAH